MPVSGAGCVHFTTEVAVVQQDDEASSIVGVIGEWLVTTCEMMGDGCAGGRCPAAGAVA